MATYSKLLGRINQTASANTAVFTAAAGVTTVIRDIQVLNGSAVPMSWYLLINGVGYGPAVPAMAVGTAFHQEGRMVLTAGDAVSFYTTAGYGSCCLSGYELSP